MTLGSRGSRWRCLLVWCGASSALLAVWCLTRGAVAGGASAVGRHGLDTLPFDRALADLSAGLLLGCAVWLWLSTTAVVLEAARGRSAAAPDWVPAAFGGLVLTCCGVAVAGVLTQPADASGHRQAHRHPERVVVTRSPLSGLPLPDRAAVTVHPHRATREGRRAVGRTVTVRAGDTLWSIAARDLPPASPDTSIARRWRAIYAANRARIGADPDLIVPGLRLRLPGKDLP